MVSKESYTEIIRNNKNLFIDFSTATSYWFLLDRGTNETVWPIASSLNQIKLSRRQACDAQWEKHFQICGLKELHDLLVADYSQITKEFILKKYPQHIVERTVNGDEELNDYNITQLESYGYKDACTLHLFEKTKSFIVVGNSSSSWGDGGQARVTFNDICDKKWQSHFEECGALELFRFFKSNRYSLTREQLFIELKTLGYLK